MGEFTALVARYGVAAVFLFTFLENMGLPVPAFPVLMLAGAYASTSVSVLAPILCAAIAGALLADGIWYRIGRWRGRRVLGRLCRVSFNPDACVERSELGFRRRRGTAILLAKFLPGVNTITPPLAGASAMPFSSFLLFDFCGALLWAAAGVALGYLFGEQIAESAQGLQGTMVWLLVAGVAGTVVWRVGYRYWLVKRYAAFRLAPEEVHRKMLAAESPLVLDLRQDEEYDRSDHMVASALRMRPASFHHRAHRLPRDRDLIFYCS
jgi:membrane protein DedA with SNARE-associated domain